MVSSSDRKEDRFDRLTRGERARSSGPVWPSDNGLEQAGLEDGSLDREVDRLLESHRAVLATLEEDVEEIRGGVKHNESRSTSVRFMRPSEEEVLERHAAPLRRRRREREMEASALRPVAGSPRLDPPLVTRAGVIYVPPAFEAAAGFDQKIADRLVRAGHRSVESFLSASDEELVEEAGVSLAQVRRAKRDLDLVRLPNMDRDTADLLRLVGVATVSRLAIMDPSLVVRDLERVQQRHRFLRLPPSLQDERSIRRIIEAAKARTE